MFENLGKILKPYLKEAIASLEEDAKQYERKARAARSSAAMMKKLLPEVLKALQPPKPIKLKPPTKAELRRINKQIAATGGIPFATKKV